MSTLTDKEIVEGNKIIEKFAGLHPAVLKFWPEQLIYHADWNELMKVVEMIKMLSVAANAPNKVTENRIFSFSIFAPIKDVWQGVIEFSQWYNQQREIISTEVK